MSRVYKELTFVGKNPTTSANTKLFVQGMPNGNAAFSFCNPYNSKVDRHFVVVSPEKLLLIRDSINEIIEQQVADAKQKAEQEAREAAILVAKLKAEQEARKTAKPDFKLGDRIYIKGEVPGLYLHPHERSKIWSWVIVDGHTVARAVATDKISAASEEPALCVPATTPAPKYEIGGRVILTNVENLGKQSAKPGDVIIIQAIRTDMGFPAGRSDYIYFTGLFADGDTRCIRSDQVKPIRKIGAGDIVRHVRTLKTAYVRETNNRNIYPYYIEFFGKDYSVPTPYYAASEIELIWADPANKGDA